MPEPFVGEVRIFAGNFAPAGWAICNGQLLAISSNTALFSLLGNLYGGNGISSFALPDLQGRLPIHPGQGPGLSLRLLGEFGGSETQALTTSQIPSHTHAMGASTTNGVSDSPAGNVPARDPAATPRYGSSPDGNLGAAAAGSSGGGQAHNNMQPYLALTFIIALQGVYPPRS